MNIERYWRRVIYVIIAILLAVVVMLNFKHISEAINQGFSVARPFLWGIAIAFVLNLPMKYIEKWLKRWCGGKKSWFRGVSLTSSLLLLIIIIALLLFLVLPDFEKTISSVIDLIPDTAEKLYNFVNDHLNRHPEIIDYIQRLDINPQELQGRILQLVNNTATIASTTLQSLLMVIVQVVSGLFNLFIAMVFAISLLIGKENLIRQFKKFTYATCRLDWANYIVNVGSLSNRVFSSFVTGQAREAGVLFVLVFLAMTLFRFPYVLSISVLMGAMTFIPIFGALIGAIVSALLISIVNFQQALLFIVVITVIQQFEGNVIYPRLVGSSVGLPVVWTLCVVTISGALYGIQGMLLSVPITSIVYQLIASTVNHRLMVKGLDIVDHTTNVHESEQIQRTKIK